MLPDEYFVDYDDDFRPIVRSIEFAPRDNVGPLVKPLSFRAAKAEARAAAQRDIDRGREITRKGQTAMREIQSLRKRDVDNRG